MLGEVCSDDCVVRIRMDDVIVGSPSPGKGISTRFAKHSGAVYVNWIVRTQSSVLVFDLVQDDIKVTVTLAHMAISV